MSDDAFEAWRAWAIENSKWTDAEIDEFLSTRTAGDTPMDKWQAEAERHLRALLDIITRQGGFMRDADLIAVQHARHHLEKKP